MKLFLASIVQFAIAFIFPVLFVRFAPWPRRWRWRALIAIIGCWFTLVWFVTQVYCPLEIAEAESRGDENPYARCDNNNIGPFIIMGWFLPALPLAAWGIVRWFSRSHEHANDA